MRAYCINLDRRPDRLAFMAGAFARHGVPFIRVPAVDGQDPAIAAQARDVGSSRFGPRISPNVYACFQSHRRIWQMLLDSGDAHAAVFEDDLILAEGIAGYMADGWVPVDADLVRLETFGSRVHLKAGPGLEVGSRRLFRLMSYHQGTGAYVVSSKAARYLLDATERFEDPIDYVLFSEASPLFARLVTYQLVPAPVIQGDRASRGSPEPWAQSSIEQRFTDSAINGPERETLYGRLRRRLLGEIGGRLRGTRYRFIPHG